MKRAEMRFLALLFCAFVAASPLHAQSFEARLVSTFKDFCIAPTSWEDMPAHGEKLARERGWQVKEAAPGGRKTPDITALFLKDLIERLWTYEEQGTTVNAVLSVIGPTLPGVRFNSCGISLTLGRDDKQKLQALRKAMPAEIERQFGSTIYLRDPKGTPFPNAPQWHFSVPANETLNCARRLIVTTAHVEEGNLLTLILNEIAFPDDRKWDVFRPPAWCDYHSRDGALKQ